MNTLGSHPGAISFRFSIMVILILIFMIYFLFYFDDAKIEIERASIQQTKRIIDSALAVVFASHAVKGKLNDLNELEGGNPFIFLRDYDLFPPGYQGVIDGDLTDDIDPGWYYLKQRKQVIYLARYIENIDYYSVVLNYQDSNRSGRFEAASDRFQNLAFKKNPQQ